MTQYELHCEIATSAVHELEELEAKLRLLPPDAEDVLLANSLRFDIILKAIDTAVTQQQ